MKRKYRRITLSGKSTYRKLEEEDFRKSKSSDRKEQEEDEKEGVNDSDNNDLCFSALAS